MNTKESSLTVPESSYGDKLLLVLGLLSTVAFFIMMIYRSQQVKELIIEKQALEKQLYLLQKKPNPVEQNSIEDDNDAINKLLSFQKMFAQIKGEKAKFNRKSIPFCLIILEIKEPSQLSEEEPNQTQLNGLKNNVLLLIHHAISETIRPYDIFGRIHENHLGILLPCTQLPETQLVLSRLLDNIHRETHQHSERVFIKFNTGQIALEETAHEFIERIEHQLKHS